MLTNEDEFLQDKLLAELDEFTDSYATSLLWSEMNMDGNLKICHKSDIHPKTLATIVYDCKNFQIDNEKWLIMEAWGKNDYLSQAGHDFAMTRNEQGCGFNDGDWREPEASFLYKSAKKYKQFGCFSWDDNFVVSGNYSEAIYQLYFMAFNRKDELGNLCNQFVLGDKDVAKIIADWIEEYTSFTLLADDIRVLTQKN
jgi:hypothetical protein